MSPQQKYSLPLSRSGWLGAVPSPGGLRFALPRGHERLKVVRRDAQDFLQAKARRGRYGVIQVDLYDMHARGPVLESAEFYRLCEAALAEPGIAVFNLFGEHASTRRNLRRIRDAFGGRVLMLPVTTAGNLVVLGFKGPPLQVGWPALAARARRLRSRLRLPADEWVGALRRHPGREGGLAV